MKCGIDAERMISMINSLVEKIALLKDKGLENEVESLLYKNLERDSIEKLKCELNKLIVDNIISNKSV
jgi:hypothetical protein